MYIKFFEAYILQTKLYRPHICLTNKLSTSRPDSGKIYWKNRLPCVIMNGRNTHPIINELCKGLFPAKIPTKVVPRIAILPSYLKYFSWMIVIRMVIFENRARVFLLFALYMLPSLLLLKHLNIRTVTYVIPIFINSHVRLLD